MGLTNNAVSKGAIMQRKACTGSGAVKLTSLAFSGMAESFQRRETKVKKQGVHGAARASFSIKLHPISITVFQPCHFKTRVPL